MYNVKILKGWDIILTKHLHYSLMAGITKLGMNKLYVENNIDLYGNEFSLLGDLYKIQYYHHCELYVLFGYAEKDTSPSVGLHRLLRYLEYLGIAIDYDPNLLTDGYIFESQDTTYQVIRSEEAYSPPW